MHLMRMSTYANISKYLLQRKGYSKPKRENLGINIYELYEHHI